MARIFHREKHLGSDAVLRTVETFCSGMNINRSIQKIYFFDMDLAGGEIFQSLSPFFQKNHNIRYLRLCCSGANLVLVALASFQWR